MVTAAVVAILAIMAWFLRDSLIQRISNPLLKEYGLSVTDVSLDALASSNASISYLELAHDKGTTIAIEGLTLPIGKTSNASKTYTAKKVTIITATRNDEEPFELALLVDQILSLPGGLGSSEVVVAEFGMPPYPTVRNLRWILKDGEQALRATVATVEMSAVITRTDATNHAITFSLPTGSATARGHSMAANMQHDERGILLSGTSSLDLPIWEPLAKLSGIIPQEITIESGAAALHLDGSIPYDTSLLPSVTADLAPSSPLQLAYSDSPGEVASIIVKSGSSVELAATFPTVEWSLHQAQATLLVTYGEWQNIPLSVSDLSCRSGPACSMNTRVVMSAAELPIGTVDRIEFASSEDVLFPDVGVRVDVKPGATLNVTGLSAPEANVGRIEARLVSTATLELIEAGWRLAADSVDGTIGAVSLSDDISVTTPLFLDGVLFSEIDQIRFAKAGVYAPSSQAVFNERTIALPGFKGSVSLQGNDTAIDLMSTGLHQNGAIEAHHNSITSAGKLTVDGATVSLGAQKLSKRVMPWRNDWDLISGTVAADLQANWRQSGSGTKFAGQASVRIADLAGHYEDTAFAGLSTGLETQYDSATGFTSKPSTISVALVEIGFPIENFNADYTLDANALAVEVENLHMTALGGVIRADPFSFRTAAVTNTLEIHAEAIRLDEYFALQEFEVIEVTGRIGANMPVTIEGGVMTIVAGTLTGEPPGGVIRYQPGREYDKNDNSSIAIVSRAMSNFEYKTLTSKVDLSKDGNLKLTLQLTGRNPDLEEKRPIVLNLGLEENVPQLLKSLQATRAVEDILTRRLEK